MYCVIGSGPAAVAAAAALVGRNLPVLIVDAAIVPDEPFVSLRRRLGSAEPDAWAADDLKELRRHTVATADGVQKKLDFGSDHVYREIPEAAKIDVRGAEVLRSFARGGLSNVWGASILPYPEKELDDWPIDAAALREHYRAVLQFVPQCGADDDLANLFPQTSGDIQSMPRSRQQDALLRDLETARRSLNDNGIRFGTARLAVDSDGMKSGSHCRRCGLCLYGCPYNLIYSSSTTLDHLTAQPGVEYQPGLWVHSLEPEGGRLRIRAWDRQTGDEVSLSATKVFLGAGIAETARIVLQSTGHFDKPVTGLHSDRLTLPAIRVRREKGIRNDALNTLCQVFLEIVDPQLCKQMIHVQIYGYNDLFPAALAAKLGRFGVRSLGMLDDLLLERLMMAFAYLHSDVSSRIEYILRPNGDLRINGRSSDEAAKITRRLSKKLRRNGFRFGTIFGRGKLHPPGGGNHSGGTFPMREQPGQLECSPQGELRGIPNLHIVDASVLPSLSSTTITLPAMANAHRIASEVSQATG